jgi:amidase
MRVNIIWKATGSRERGCVLPSCMMMEVSFSLSQILDARLILSFAQTHFLCLLVCKPIPPYKRALDEAKSALELAGHKVIEWEPLDNEEGGSILLELFNADGGEDIDAACALSGEPRIKTVLTEGGKHLSTFEYWQLCKRRAAHIKRQLDHWESTVLRTGTGRPVDAIIAPAGGTGPVPHGQDQYIYYTAMCNLMDWTAAVFPMTEIDPLKDPKKSKEARNEVEKKIHDLCEFIIITSKVYLCRLRMS